MKTVNTRKHVNLKTLSTLRTLDWQELAYVSGGMMNDGDGSTMHPTESTASTFGGSADDCDGTPDCPPPIH